MVGAVLAARVFLCVWLGFGGLVLAFAVASAVMFAGFATGIGLIPPWTLPPPGSDPAGRCPPPSRTCSAC